MAAKELKARLVQRHDIEENWNKATNFKPLLGEIIVYNKDESHSRPRIKIGDGNTLITDLPFIDINESFISGESPLTITDASEVKHLMDISLTSKDTNISDFSSVQVGRYGKNLLKLRDDINTISQDGITYTWNSSTGEIVLNGENKSEENISNCLLTLDVEDSWFVEHPPYTISLNNIEENENVFLGITNQDYTKMIFTPIGTQSNIKAVQEGKDISVTFYSDRFSALSTIDAVNLSTFKMDLVLKNWDDTTDKKWPENRYGNNYQIYFTNQPEAIGTGNTMNEATAGFGLFIYANTNGSAQIRFNKNVCQQYPWDPGAGIIITNIDFLQAEDTTSRTLQIKIEDGKLYINGQDYFTDAVSEALASMGGKAYVNITAVNDDTRDTQPAEFVIKEASIGEYGDFYSKVYCSIPNATSTQTTQYTKGNIFICCQPGCRVENFVLRPQIELGPTATAYEPCTFQITTANADGTVDNITSLPKNNILIADTEDIIINCKYLNNNYSELQHQQINYLLSDYVTKTQYASIGVPGLVSMDDKNGLKMKNGINGTSIIAIDSASTTLIDQRKYYNEYSNPITCSNLDYAVRASLTDGKQLVEWTDSQKAAARNLLGIGNSSDVNLDEYVKKTDYADQETAGVVRVPALSGLIMENDGNITLQPADEGIFPYRKTTAPKLPITLGNVDFAVKACLANNKDIDGTPFVEWSDEEKAAARNLLGITGSTTGSNLDQYLKVENSKLVSTIDIIPSSTQSLGTSTYPWNTAYVNGINAYFVPSDFINSTQYLNLSAKVGNTNNNQGPYYANVCISSQYYSSNGIITYGLYWDVLGPALYSDSGGAILGGADNKRWGKIFTGSIDTTTAVTVSSDRSMKDSIVYLDEEETPITRNRVVDFVKSLKPVTFCYKHSDVDVATADNSEDTYVQIGFIAQDMEESDTDMFRRVGAKHISTHKDDAGESKESISYSLQDLPLTATALVAIQEILKENKTLKERLEIVEEKLNSL